MQILTTHHMALYTSNFAVLRDFYTQMLGLELLGGFAGRQIIFLSAGSTTIELVEVKEGEHGKLGWAHLAFEVADVDAACAELQALGITFHVPPRDFPSEHPVVRIAFFKDPDGNELELVQPFGPRYPAL